LKIEENQLGFKSFPNPQIFENPNQSRLENQGKNKVRSKPFQVLGFSKIPTNPGLKIKEKTK